MLLATLRGARGVQLFGLLEAVAPCCAYGFHRTVPRGPAPAFGVGFHLFRLQRDFHLPFCVHAGRNPKAVLAPAAAASAARGRGKWARQRDVGAGSASGSPLRASLSAVGPPTTWRGLQCSGACVAWSCARRAAGLRREAHAPCRAHRVTSYVDGCARHGSCAGGATPGRPPGTGNPCPLIATQNAGHSHSPATHDGIGSRRLLRRRGYGLRGRRLGVSFRRQVVLGRYITDFFAAEVGLVVEVDGGYHRSRRAADARRDEWLRRRGYRVVRVSADAVMRRLGDVSAAIGQVA